MHHDITSSTQPASLPDTLKERSHRRKIRTTILTVTKESLMRGKYVVKRSPFFWVALLFVEYEPFKNSENCRTFCASIVCSIVFVENISKIPHSVTYTDERARAQIMRFYPP